MNTAFITRHFGQRSVAKLAALGADLLGLEDTQGGPKYRLVRDGVERVVDFDEIAVLLGWWAA
jgi:hypothetical protein